MDTYWNVKKLVLKYKLVSLFGAKSIVDINYCDAASTVATSPVVLR